MPLAERKVKWMGPEWENPSPIDVYAAPPSILPLLQPPNPYQPNYPFRINAFTSFCSTIYGIDPCGAACLLLPFITPPLAYPPLWLILHSTKSLLWDHLSLAIQRLGLPPIDHISVNRLLPIQGQFNYAHTTLLTRRMPRLFLDHAIQDDSRPIHSRRRRTYAESRGVAPYHFRSVWFRELEKECLRLTIPIARVPPPPPGSAEQLATLFLQAVDYGKRLLLPVPIQPSGAFLSALHLLAQLNPEFTHWPALSTQLCLAPAAHAALSGRTELDAKDKPILDRLLKSQLYGWRWEVLRELAGPATTVERIVAVSGAPRPSVVAILTDWTAAGICQWQSVVRARFEKKQLTKKITTRPIDPKSKRQQMIHGTGRGITLTAEYGPDVRALVNADTEWW